LIKGFQESTLGEIAKWAMEKVESKELFPLSHSPDYDYGQYFGPGITL
jgi:hypothetical protein